MDAVNGAGSPSHSINGSTPKRNNNPYVRNTVERAIHRHRVVIFSKNEQDRLGHIINGLFDDTPNTPFQSHEIKCYYLDELPSQHDIEQVLKRMADESSPSGKKKTVSPSIMSKSSKGHVSSPQRQHHHHSNNHRSPKQESRQPSLSPPSSPPTTDIVRPRVTFSSETKGGTSMAPPSYELVPSDCYVFVNGRYLSLYDIRDFFVRLAPSSRSVQIFLEYTQRKHYLHPYNNINNKMMTTSRPRPTQSYHTYPSRQYQQQQHYHPEHSPTTRDGTAKPSTTTYHHHHGGGYTKSSRPYSSSTYPPTTTSKQR